MREIVIPVRRPCPRMVMRPRGFTGSGKTRFMATMPKVAIISVGDESGWTTIDSMDQALFYEPNRPPRIFVVDQIADLPAILNQLRPLIQAGQIESIGFDSATFYGDLWLTACKQANPGIDNRQLYGGFGDHMREVRVTLHQLGQNVNVMWSALTTTPDKEDKEDLAKPMIPGAQGDKFAAACDFVFYFNMKTVVPAPGKPSAQKFEIRTRRYGRSIARGRDSGVLPDPLPFHTYRELRACLDKGVRSAVPPPPTDAELAASETQSSTENAAPSSSSSSSASRGPHQVSPPQGKRTFKV